jgi:chromosome segregation ATPase
VEFEINRLKRLISIGDHQVEQQSKRITELEQQLKMQSDLMEESEGDLTTKLLDAQGRINQLESHIKDASDGAAYWRNLYETETASAVKDCGEKAKAIALLRAEIAGHNDTRKRLEANVNHWVVAADKAMNALLDEGDRVIKLKAKIKKLKRGKK